MRGTSVSAEWFHSDFKNLICAQQRRTLGVRLHADQRRQPDRRLDDPVLQRQRGRRAAAVQNVDSTTRT
jgi:hypothetical protein